MLRKTMIALFTVCLDRHACAERRFGPRWRVVALALAAVFHGGGFGGGGFRGGGFHSAAIGGGGFRGGGFPLSRYCERWISQSSLRSRWFSPRAPVRVSVHLTHPPVTEGLREPGRREGPELIGRREAARRDRAHGIEGRRDPGAGRGRRRRSTATPSTKSRRRWSASRATAPRYVIAHRLSTIISADVASSSNQDRRPLQYRARDSRRAASRPAR